MPEDEPTSAYDLKPPGTTEWWRWTTLEEDAQLVDSVGSELGCESWVAAL